MATGDSGREAYTAIAWGVGLSHERSDIAGAEGFHSLEGNMCGTAMRGADALPRSKATSRGKGSHRNLGRSRIWPPSSRAVCVRRSALGRRGAEANDARTREVGPRHSSFEAGEQSEGSPLRRRLRGRTQRSWWSAPAQHVLDPEPGSRDKRAGAYTATFDVTPEVGAVCGKAARTVLCGGNARPYRSSRVL